jgi:P27 family predicted phage terminase small subunit
VPHDLKIQRGTWKPASDKVRGVRVPAMLTHITPPPPAHLDDFHREVWNRFAADVGEMRICTRQDLAALEMLTDTYVEMRKLRAEIMELPTLTFPITKIVEGKDGTRTTTKTLAIRPEVAALNAVDNRLLGLLGRFGLTPADRGRVDDLGAPKPGGKGEEPEQEFG